MSKRPSDIVQVNLRIPYAMRRAVAAEARKNKRSLNQEIAHRLTQPLVQELTTNNIENAAIGTAAKFDELNKRLADVADAVAAILAQLGRADLAELLKSHVNEGEGAQNG